MVNLGQLVVLTLGCLAVLFREWRHHARCFYCGEVGSHEDGCPRRIS